LEHAERPENAPPAISPAVDAAMPAARSKDTRGSEEASESQDVNENNDRKLAAEAGNIIRLMETADAENTTGAQPAAVAQEAANEKKAALATAEPNALDAPGAADIGNAGDGKDHQGAKEAEVDADGPYLDKSPGATQRRLTPAKDAANADAPVSDISPFLVTPAGVAVMAPIAAALANAPPRVDTAAADGLPRVDKLVALQTAAGNAPTGANKLTQPPSPAKGDAHLNSVTNGEVAPAATPQDDDAAAGGPRAGISSQSNEPDRPARPLTAIRNSGGQAPTTGDAAQAIKAGGEAAQTLGLTAPAIHANATVALNLASATPASPTVVPAAPAPLVGLAVEIATQAHAGIQRFEIRLDPPELGRIDVRLDVDRDGNVTSRLVVDRPDTLDLLKRDAAQIERALQEAGLKTSGNALEFSLRQQSFAHDETAPQTSAQLIVPDDDRTPLEAIRQGYGRLLGLGGGLDIRV
jgi:flagellar hook-length control protein FliK